MRNIKDSLGQIIDNLLLIKNFETVFSQIDKDILLQNIREAYLLVLGMPVVDAVQNTENQLEENNEKQDFGAFLEKIEEEIAREEENKKLLESSDNKSEIQTEPEPQQEEEEMDTDILEFIKDVPKVRFEPEIKFDEEPEVKSVPEKKVEETVQTKVEVKPVVESQPVAEPASEFVPAPEPAVVSEPQSQSQAILEPEPVVIPEPQPQKESEPELKSLLEQKVEETSQTKVEVKPVVESEPVAEPASEFVPAPEPAVVPEPQSQAILEPEPVVIPESQPLEVSEPEVEIVPEHKEKESLQAKLEVKPEPVKPQQRSLNDLFNEKKQDLGDKFQQAKINDLTKAMSINDKFLFIRELFKNKSEEFSRAIHTLNSCENIEEAFDIMEGLKKQYFWDSTSSAYLALCDLVRRKF